MKKILLTISAFSAFVLSQAQDCKSYLYMTANGKIEMTIYDKKGEVSGKQIVQVTNVNQTGGGYESTVSTSMVDEKGKAIMNGTGTYRCMDGMFSADMKMLMPQEGMGKTDATQAKFEPVYLEYPTSLSEGQALKNAEFIMNTSGQGGMNSTVTFKEENRRVAGKESVTSPAGTWQAYVISYDGSMKIKMGPIGMPAFNYSAKEWFVPGVGVVKTESYSKNGKLLGSTLITSFTK